MKYFATAMEKIASSTIARVFSAPTKKKATRKPERDFPWDKDEGERGRKGDLSLFEIDAQDWRAQEGTTINPQT